MRLKSYALAAALTGAAFFSFTGDAAAQGAITQSGPATVGHNLMFIANGRAMDAGDATNSSLPGTRPVGNSWINTGLGSCGYDAYATLPYHSMCWGFDGSGNALISYAGVGGASVGGLYIDINGTRYSFPGTGNGDVVGPVSSVVGNVAAFNNTGGTLLADTGVSLRKNATATGFTLTNQALFMDGTLTGTGLGPYAEMSIADTAVNTTVGSLIAGLRVDHTFGTGTGNRAAMAPTLIMSAATSGTNDALKFYHAMFSQFYGRANDGGSAPTAKGNAYGAAAIAQLENGATYWNSLQGMEVDVSAQAGSSVKYKSALTVASVNSDAVKGSSYDAMIGLLRDGTAYWDYGIAFGRPGAGSWPIVAATGTLIGVPADSGVPEALYGVDLTNLIIHTGGCAFKSQGYCVDPSGNPTSGSALIQSVAPYLSFYDTGAAVPQGRARLATDGAGAWLFQLNTAAGTPFSSLTNVWAASVTGKVGFNQTTPLTLVDVNGTFRVTQASPAAAAACSAGQIVGDANYLYTCSASGAWKRVAVTGGY